MVRITVFGHGRRGVLCGVLLALAFGACASPAPSTPAATATAMLTPPPRADMPTVNPDYIYTQLDYMATHFLRREAGYDTGLPPTQNGHDEFAAYWSQEMSNALQGFGPTVSRDSFATAGWRNRPPQTQAFNVEVTVPGAQHSEQMVVIGCHYDAEAFSTQSANDDASGCAIELGIASAMANYWREHQLVPARTLRFVLFDAEEQGLYGSFHYINSTINGDLANVVAMFNEEQNGIAYPLRFLGKAANPLLPFYMDFTPLHANQTYQTLDQLTQRQRDQITAFRGLVGQAVSPVFSQFRAIGRGAVSYTKGGGESVVQPVYTPDQQKQIVSEDDTLGASDEMPFTFAGLPCATLIGNTSYYPEYGGSHPPPWSYPFDQPQDSIQLMNTYASGTTTKAEALVLALALPGMLTAWMLSQPTVLGSVPTTNGPIVAISDIGPTVIGTPVTVNAGAAHASAAGSLSYVWDFGDGAKASGVTVTHTYAAAGNYYLRLIVQGAGGTTTVTKVLSVNSVAPNFPNPYEGFRSSGMPPSNPAITIPAPQG